jgi:hypothetical protein
MNYQFNIIIFIVLFSLIKCYYINNIKLLNKNLINKNQITRNYLYKTKGKTNVNKMNEFIKLIRIKNNFFPTLALNFIGGYIMNPSFISLIQNSSFIYSCIITQLVLYASMIINDLFDINVQLYLKYYMH